MKTSEWKNMIHEDSFLQSLSGLYGSGAKDNIFRYEKLLALFEETFGTQYDVSLFSAPGRTEIGGNHTDHQHGRVLAASVDMDMIAAAAPTDDGRIRVLSQGYPMCELSVDELEPVEEEKNTTMSLIRGVAAAFAAKGCRLGGFCAAVSSSVLPGSGISSSAAFEVLIGCIINGLFFEEKATAIEIAQIGQYAENVYFGKPSGLMDQMASSVGNILTIDFEDTANPVVRKLDADFEKSGLALCIIDSGADHADLTDEYAAIPGELRQVCAMFGKQVLRDIPKEEFLSRFAEVRKECGDRAVLRAMHFYADNDRVPKQAAALEEGNIELFLKLVRESGASSFMYLQNIVPAGSIRHQEMAAALALCDCYLGERGAFRVHGGGFAGTVQAFVPMDMLDEFRENIEKALGEGSCHVLRIRPTGGTSVKA